MDSVTGASRRQLARIAGALYLINVVGGAFAIGWKRSPVVAPIVECSNQFPDSSTT
jgi:hypothetical protein